MQRPQQVPWFGIIVLVIALNIFTDIDLPIVPIIIGAVVLNMVLGPRRRRSTRGPSTQQPLPSGGSTGASTGTDNLPRIDVPRYPDQAPPIPGPSTTVTTPEPGSGLTSTPSAAAGGTAYPGSTSTDPVVSLGQLHLARLGSELDAAARTGRQAEVARLLGEVHGVIERSTTMLSGADGSPGSGRSEFAAGLRRLEREVSAARREQPAGPRVHRVVQTCTVMGQTGRYE